MSRKRIWLAVDKDGYKTAWWKKPSLCSDGKWISKHPDKLGISFELPVYLKKAQYIH